ncbi:unnamed protein product, partial [Adineta steineri]
TATNQLFLSNPQINLWQFEVVYSFLQETSSSSLNIVLTKSPSNGSCLINPLNGTTNSLFDVLCSNWFDDNDIKDYSVYVWKNDLAEKMIVAYSTISSFQVRLPPGDDQTSLLHLFVHIRNQFDCVTEFNLSSVTVMPDLVGLTDFMNNIQNLSSELIRNPITQLLGSQNQNVVGQLIISLSQQLNKMNNENIDTTILNGIPATSISVSTLGSQTSQVSSIPLNESALIEYNTQLNSHANTREYLMTFIAKLAITTPNSVKLQATALAQITETTNELTRTTLMTASERCYQLAMALYPMSTGIPYEDVQLSATQLIQCAANVLTAVNGPLQQRTTILDLDYSRATTFPADYDTDLESAWSNPNLFADGNDFSWETIERNRNIYYQKQLANQIINQMNEIIALLSSSLNIHLNIGQQSIIDTSQVFMSLESKSIESLSNKLSQPMINVQIQLPENLNLNLSNNSKISIRTMVTPLAPFGNTTTQSNTNLSTCVSFSILDENENEISVQTDLNRPIEIIIPRDSNLIIPSMILQNVTSMNSTPHNQLFNFQYINITSTLPISVHLEIQPLNSSLAYLFIYKFDQVPQLNSSIKQIDGSQLFCPSGLTNESIYHYFLDNQQTFGHQSLIFGLRELNSTEMSDVCSNSSITYLPITNERFNFTSNYQLRIYTSGCYYIDNNNQW